MDVGAMDVNNVWGGGQDKGKGKSKDKGKGKSKDKGKPKGAGRGRGAGVTGYSFQGICDYCERWGHRKSVCWWWLR